MSSSEQERDIRIKAQPSKMDPDSCTFTTNRSLWDGGAMQFSSRDEAAGSPLPAKLMDLQGIRKLVVHHDSLVIRKEASTSWHSLAPQVGNAVRELLQSGTPLVVPAARSAYHESQSDEELATAVREVLDKQINTSVSAHGGRVELVEVREKVARLRLMGRCQGCSSAPVTVQQGVKVVLQRAVPGILAVEDITDHSVGNSPYHEEPRTTPF